MLRRICADDFCMLYRIGGVVISCEPCLCSDATVPVRLFLVLRLDHGRLATGPIGLCCRGHVAQHVALSGSLCLGDICQTCLLLCINTACIMLCRIGADDFCLLCRIDAVGDSCKPCL